MTAGKKSPLVSRWKLRSTRECRPFRVGPFPERSRQSPFAAWVLALALLNAAVAGADDRLFTLGRSSLSLHDDTAEVVVRYQSMRLNRALNVWNVDVVLENTGRRILRGPFVLLVDGFTGTTGPQLVDGTAGGTPPRAFYDFSGGMPEGTLGPGERSLARPITLGLGAGTPSLVTKVYTLPERPPSALAIARSLDEAGQPLPNVRVEENGPLGSVTNVTDPVFGVITLGQAAGPHLWKFSKPGHLPVWRQQTLSTGAVTVIPDPRLVRRGTNAIRVTPIGGAVAKSGDASVQILLSPGAVAQDATVTLTPLTGQTLPAFLPSGWSPLQAFEVEMSVEPALPAVVQLKPWDALGNAEALALARWNDAAQAWETVQLLSGQGTNAISATLTRTGAYALVVRDASPQAPPAPLVGQALGPGNMPLPDLATLTATATVRPASSPASRLPDLVTATAQVVVSSPSGPLPSGLILRGEVFESYRLRDGTRRQPPQYENFVVGYQRPGDARATTLHAAFPMRPLLLFGAEELDQATVRMDVLTPTPFAGGVLDAGGGLIASGGARVLAGAGDFLGRQAAEARRLSPTNFAALVDSNFLIAAVFELSVAGVAPGRHLAAQVESLPANGSFVLARVLYDQGLYGLQPLERLRSDVVGRLASVEPIGDTALSGLAGAGQFVLLKSSAPQGVVRGMAMNSSGEPAAGAAIRVTGQPWLTFADDSGAFRLLAPTGQAQVVMTDLPTGDSGQVSAQVPDVVAGGIADFSSSPTGPRVLSINPADGAARVSRVTPIAITLSEPVNPATLLNGGVLLLGSNGVAVASSLTLNQRGTTATLLPVNPLSPSTLYHVVISNRVSDLVGSLLEGPASFSFTTESDRFNRLTAQVISYEPTNHVAVMLGTAGIAEPSSPVILVNETTGQTATILSKADGSFSNSIPADVDDLLSAVVINANGTRNTIPAGRQLFRDGSVALFHGGGILEAESDGGPVQVFVEPGAIPGKTKFKMELLELGQLLAVLSNTPPRGGTFLGRGVKITAEGDSINGPMDVSMPVTPADLARAGLPADARPEEAVYGMVVPTQLKGDTAYLLLDKMEFANGRLETHSPPFPGADFLLHSPDRAKEAMDSLGVSVLVQGASLSVGGVATPLVAIPLLMAVKSQPVIFTGKVIDITLDESTNALAARPLPGALVTIRPLGAGLFSGARPGRLDPGEIYGSSRANGSYALMLPRPIVGDLQQPEPRDDFVLTAQHPSRFGDRVETLASVAVSTVRLTDLIFTHRASGSAQDRRPPQVSLFYSPLQPAPGSTATVTVLATHGSTQPSIDPLQVLDVKSLLPGVAVSLGDATANPPVPQTVGATAVRATFDVTCSSTSLVVFKLQANVPGASVEVPFAIPFSGSSLILTNPISGDANDRVHPRVIQSHPQFDAVEQSAGLSPGESIVLEFNEAIDPSNLSTAVQIFPVAGTPLLELSPDQRQLKVTYYNLEQGRRYTLTVGTSIHDLSPNANQLDQNPLTPGPDPFVLSFFTAPQPGAPLPGLDAGGGVVTRGIYAYALERAGSLDGSVVVYDLSDPQHPDKVTELSVPGFPRDLALIPSYSFRRRPDADVETKDLLAVVGGKVGGSPDENGNLLGGFQFLWIIDLSDPKHPQRLASAAISLSAVTAVTKVQWSPPLLAYLESAADIQSIGLVNLQSFILSSYLKPEEFATEFNLGVDANGDGDFVDVAEGDQLPIPRLSRDEFGGKIGSLVLGDTDQRILDFTLNGRTPYVGVIVGPGQVLDETGQPSGQQAPAAYRTLLDGELALDRTIASFLFTNELPKRLFALFDARITLAGQDRLANLAFVSVEPPSGGTSNVKVLDITDPTNPTLIQSIEIPAQHGLVQSIQERDDGLLMLATSRDVLLLDPARLTEPAQPGAPHPALIGIIQGMGSGARSFGGVVAGLNVVNLGGQHEFRQTAPRLTFVSFPHTNAFAPATVVNNIDLIQTLLAGKERKTSLFPCRVKSIPGVVESSLDPTNADVHYYVLVDAPGSAGDKIELALESLNEFGFPLRNKGLGFPPVRAMSSSGLNDIHQVPQPGCDAPIRTLTAWRLTTNSAHPFYNLYLSRPFLLTYESLATNDLSAIRGQLDREILWSGHFLRAYLDSSDSQPVLDPFRGIPDTNERILRPGASVYAQALPGDYILGPNPPTAAGYASVPGSFGSVAVHSGELRNSTVDISLPSRRLPIVFKRTIAAQDLYEGPFGRGWDFSYNQRLISLSQEVIGPGMKVPVVIRNSAQDEVATRGDLLFCNGEGLKMLYRFAGTNPPPEFAGDPLVSRLGWFGKAAAFYHSPLGVFDMLLQFQDKKFVRLLPDGTQFWYNPQGRLESVAHRYTNNVHLLHYDDAGELVRIEDLSVSVPRYLNIGYYREPNAAFVTPADEGTSNPSLVGRIRRVQDYIGRDVRFNYDDCGELILREGVEVSSAHPPGFVGRQHTYYTYAQGSSGADYPGANAIAGIIAGSQVGTPLINAAALVRQNDVPVVQRLNGGIGSVDVDVRYGNTAADLAAGRGLVRTQTSDGSSCLMTLGKFGLAETSHLEGNGANAVDYQTRYSDQGLLLEQIAPLQNSTRLTYDDLNQNLRSQANLLNVERIPKPGSGDSTLRAEFHYDSLYNLAMDLQTDFDGNVIRNVPTPDGLDIGEIRYPSQPAQNVTLAGSAVSVPAAAGGTERMVYNLYGQLEQHETTEGVLMKFTYDGADGFVRSFTRGTGQNEVTTRFEYQAFVSPLGLASKKIPPTGASILLDYDEREQLMTFTRSNLITKLSYDESGRTIRKATQIDPSTELVETNEFLPNGFLRRRALESVETSTGTATQTSQDLVTEFEPDAIYRTHLIRYPGGETKTFEDYDHLGRIGTVRIGSGGTGLPGGQGPTYTETYQYDDNNNCLSVTRGNSITLFEYDGHDRLKKESVPLGAGSEETHLRYFDGGQLKESILKSADGTTNRHVLNVLDSQNRAIARLTRADQGVAVQLFGYDGSTRTRTVVSPVGEITSSIHDDAGRARVESDSLAVSTNSYGAGDNLEQATSRQGTNLYTHILAPYDPLDRSVQRADDLGFIGGFSYRADGQVLDTTDARSNHQHSAYTKLAEPTLHRSATGIEIHRGYNRNRNLVFEGDGQSQGRSYDYDPTLQLVSETERDNSTKTFQDLNALRLATRVTFPNQDIAIGYDLRGRRTGATNTYLGTQRQETYDWDAQDSPTSVSFPGGSLSFRYDLLGPLRESRLVAGGRTFTLRHDIRLDGLRTNLQYSSSVNVTEARDIAGRILAIAPRGAEPVMPSVQFEGVTTLREAVLGPNLLRCENTFDARPRLARRRYSRVSDGKILAEFRYAYDANDNVILRQAVHRGARADLFQYDPDNRLTRADLGIRPAVPLAKPRVLAGFVPPPGLPGTFAPGLFAREYHYDPNGLDQLIGSQAVNPDNLAMASFPTNIGAFDLLLHAGQIDGFTRTHDSRGNTTRTVLQVRLPGTAGPTPVPATLQYDGKDQLIKLTRDDGVVIDYEYQHDGLCFHRQVTGPPNRCVPSDRFLIWDAGRLLEEYDRTGTNFILRARYYYANGLTPVAADLGSGATLERFYLLSDLIGSIASLVDSAGRVVEHYSYDAWGNPSVEPADSAPPLVNRLVSAPDGILIEFSERVLPPFAGQQDGVIASLLDFTAGLTFSQSGTALAGTFSFEESRPGFPFGSVIRFQPATAVSGALTLQVQPGVLVDEWNNPIAATNINFTFSAVPGAVLFSLGAATSQATVARSAHDQPFLFQGEYFDLEAGLIYLRSRFYDPAAGLFLQQDPASYGVSVNFYGAFAHNPQSARDPSGRNPLLFLGAAAGGALIAGGVEAYMEYRHDGRLDPTKIGAHAAGGAAAALVALIPGGGVASAASGVIVASLAQGVVTRTLLHEKAFSDEGLKGDFAGAAIGGVAGGALGAVVGKVGGPVLGKVFSRLGGSSKNLGRSLAGTAVRDVDATLGSSLERTEVFHMEEILTTRVEHMDYVRLRGQADAYVQAADQVAGLYTITEIPDLVHPYNGRNVAGLHYAGLRLLQLRANMADVAKLGTKYHELGHAVDATRGLNPYLEDVRPVARMLFSEAIAEKHRIAALVARGLEDDIVRAYRRGGDDWLVTHISARWRGFFQGKVIDADLLESEIREVIGDLRNYSPK